jgi:glycosyltransferase involved in cell wall biosynthesis
MEKIVRHADLDGRASGAFKHYFLVVDDEPQSEDVQLAIHAFRKFRSSHPEFGSFRLIVAGAVGPTSQQGTRRSNDGVENVRCHQLTGGEEELSRLYRDCYAVILTSRPKNPDASLEGGHFAKPIIAIRRAKLNANLDRESSGLLCEATPEALASTMARLARGSGFFGGATG